MPSENEIENTGDEFDMNSALDEISSGLFGQDSDGGTDSTPVGAEPSPTPTGETPPQTSSPEGSTTPPEAPPAENSEAVQTTGAPSTWSKDSIAEWAAIPPRAQQEILKREQDMFRGLEQYKDKADLGSKYDAVVEPFRAALTAENVDPVQLFQSFSANHYTLARGTPEQKVQLAANLLSSYGIPLEAVQQYVGNQPPANPQFDQVTQRLQTVEQELQAERQAKLEVQKANFRTEVENFAKDPANIYFEEVAGNIADILKSQPGINLAKAYEQAVWNNPATRQKEIDRATATTISERQRDEAGRFQAAEAAKGANVKTKSKSANGTIPVGTLDETLEDTLAKIQARG